MSFSGSQKDTSATTTNTLDPQYQSAVYGNLARAQGVADTPFQPYAGQQVAAFTPGQLQAQGAYTDLANDQTGSAPLNAAIGLAQGAGAYQPQTVSTRPLTGVDLSGYSNPYTSSVVDTTLQDLDRQHQIQDTNDAAKATAAGAFGGSRSAVLQNLDDDSYARTAASTAASLNQANYAQAQAAAQADLARGLQASLANQNAGLAGQTLNLNAAGNLANMGAQQLNQGLQYAGALNIAGGAQQQNQQDQLNAAYQQWLLAQQYPAQMQTLLNSTVAGLPKTGTTTQDGSETTESENAGLNTPIKILGTPFSFI